MKRRAMKTIYKTVEMIRARVEITFDFELGGESAIRLGYSDGRQSSAARFQAYQWAPYPYDWVNSRVIHHLTRHVVIRLALTRASDQDRIRVNREIRETVDGRRI